EPQGKAGPPHWVVMVLTAVAVATIFTTYFFGDIGLAGLIPITGLFIFILWKMRNSQANERIKLRKEDFESTGLEAPVRWDADSVKQKLDELISDLQDSKWYDRIDR